MASVRIILQSVVLFPSIALTGEELSLLGSTTISEYTQTLERLGTRTYDRSGIRGANPNSERERR